MYYGYEMMSTLTFVPAGFVITVMTALSFTLVYAVGASRGARAAGVYSAVCTWITVAAFAADVVYAVASGQWKTFIEWYGTGPLFEMGLLALMFVGSMWFMAMSYSGTKRREEAGAEPARAEQGQR